MTQAKRILVCTRKGLAIVRRTSAGWSIDTPLAFQGDPVIMALHDPRGGGAIYAAINLGHFGQKLHRSTDDGATWKEIAVPVYPPKPEGAPDVVCPMRQIPFPWSLQMIWSLETGAAEGQLWCGTIPGGLFVSYDHGDSWQLCESLWNRPERAKWFGGGYDWPGIHSICIDPRDPRQFSIAISCGGVWHTSDDGATWENRTKGMRAGYMPPDAADEPDIQDPHLMVRCAAAPDTLWIQHHSGIFRSIDNAKTWTPITTAIPSDFGFAVAVHPNDPNTAWFAPGIKDEQRIPVDAKFVISRTQDGGKTFEILHTGLPVPPAYHLIYRHSLVVDNTGQLLALGSTTGSLWISENGGNTWQRISAELPPISAVRILG